MKARSRYCRSRRRRVRSIFTRVLMSPAMPICDLGAARHLRVLERLALDGALGRDQPAHAARVRLLGEQVVRALRVVAVELVVDRRRDRLVLVQRHLDRAAVQPHLLADDVLQLVAAAVEVAAVDLDAQHVGDVHAAADQTGQHRLLLGGGAVEHHRRLGADEGVGPLAVVLQLHARHRGAAALVLGRAAPGQAPAVAQAEAVARGRERGQRDALLLLARRIEPVRDADVRPGVAEVDAVLGQVVDAQDQRALDLPRLLVEVLVQDAVRQRLVAGEARVVVVEEERAERVGPAEAPAGHARDGLARLGEHVLVGQGQVEADVHEAGLPAGAAVDLRGRRVGAGGVACGPAGVVGSARRPGRHRLAGRRLGRRGRRRLGRRGRLAGGGCAAAPVGAPAAARGCGCGAGCCAAAGRTGPRTRNNTGEMTAAHRIMQVDPGWEVAAGSDYGSVRSSASRG